MAEVAQNDNGKGKKGAQKKIAIRVDFTPMVDMNMLLITFFMLCTTMIKSQTLQITLPSNDKLQTEQLNQAKESEAYTLILDTEWNTEKGIPAVDPETGKTIHNIYWYHGKPDTTNYHQEGREFIGKYLNKEQFIGDGRDASGNRQQQGIRKILRTSNAAVMEKVDEYKQLWRDKKITRDSFDVLAKQARTDSTLSRPVVIIKPGPNTTYEGLIHALDEMGINQISRYSIQLPTHADTMLIQQLERETGQQIIVPNIR